MKPTRENYEIWCIDYLDGKLSNDDIAEFMLFLAENPDLSDEFDDMRGLSTISPAVDSKLHFSHLKKGFAEEQLNKDTFEEFCIAYHEGDLAEKDIDRLFTYLSNYPEHNPLFNAYKKLKLQADYTIHFPGKNRLKKNTPIPSKRLYKFILPLTAAAAAIALIISIELPLRPIAEKQHASTESTKRHYNQDITQPDTPSVPNIQSVTNAQSMVSETSTHKSTELSASNKVIAVFDTSSDRPDIFIPAVQPKSQDIQIASRLNQTIILPTRPLHESPDNKIEEFLEVAEVKTFRVKSALLKPSLDNMLRRSVEGINQIAETDLQYHSDTDSDGRLLAFALTSERFNFKRKMRSN